MNHVPNMKYILHPDIERFAIDDSYYSHNSNTARRDGLFFPAFTVPSRAENVSKLFRWLCIWRVQAESTTQYSFFLLSVDVTRAFGITSIAV